MRQLTLSILLIFCLCGSVLAQQAKTTGNNEVFDSSKPRCGLWGYEKIKKDVVVKGKDFEAARSALAGHTTANVKVWDGSKANPSGATLTVKVLKKHKDEKKYIWHLTVRVTIGGRSGNGKWAGKDPHYALVRAIEFALEGILFEPGYCG